MEIGLRVWASAASHERAGNSDLARQRFLEAADASRTAGDAVGLAAAALGWVHVPGPPVEAIIALSIVFVAAEVVHGLRGNPGLTARAPWVVAFTFGLLHGFGFAGALQELGDESGRLGVRLTEVADFSNEI